MNSLQKLAENWDLVTFGVGLVTFLVQVSKNYLRNSGYEVDPRYIAGIFAGTFSLIANLVHIGIRGISWQEVAANWYVLGSSTFALAILVYKLVHKKKESTEASL